MRNARLKPEIIDRAKNRISRIFELNQQIKDTEVTLASLRALKDSIDETKGYSHHTDHARRLRITADDLATFLTVGVNVEIDLISDKLDNLHLQVDGMFNETK